jgi:CCR4-NOT transcription complex subunit 7/8
MPPAVSRFGPQIGSGPFSHIQQSHLQHPNQQHHPPGSGGLPPPSYNSHHTFTPGNPSSNISPFPSSTNGNGLAGGFGTGTGLPSAGTGLASHAAQMGFAHGAALQQQQAREAIIKSSGGTSGGKGQMKGRIRDVWRNNLVQEMQILRGLVDKYPYISMVRLRGGRE